MKKIAQLLHNILSFLIRLRFCQALFVFLSFWTRKAVLKFGDPIIEHVIVDRVRIKMPFSHNLWAVQAQYPDYALNLVRLIEMTSAYYKDCKVIDVGANIGDSVTLIKNSISVPILAVEGSPYFFELLKNNVSTQKDVICAKYWLGSEDKIIKANYKKAVGSGFLTNGSEEQQENIYTLGSMLNNFPHFQNFRFLKIDADGYDFEIIKGAKDVLLSNKAVVFFEYDPAFKNTPCPIDESVFNYFRNWGYSHFISYFNTGEFAYSGNLADLDLLHQMHNHIKRHPHIFYDICVFHETDSGLFKKVESSEKKGGAIAR